MARLLFVSNQAWNFTNFRLPLLRHLAHRGHEVVVAARRDGSEPQIEAAGLRFIDWPLVADGTHPIREWSSLRALAQIYDAVRPDVALHYTIKAVTYGGMIAYRRRVPYLSFITGLGFSFINRGAVAWLARVLYRLVLSRSRTTVFLNKDDIAEFRAHGLLGSGAVALLPGEGVDVEHFAPRPSPTPANSNEFRVLFIGRLLADKGVREFIEAARQLNGSHMRFKLLGPVGSRNPTAIDRAELDRWLAEGHVQYLGSTDDVRPAIAAADVVVLPSYREGLPRVLLEASAMAVPVVATDVPGCRDVVQHGLTGLLVPPKDPQALAAAIKRMASLVPQERHRMGEAGRRFVTERFANEHVFVIYDSLLET